MAEPTTPLPEIADAADEATTLHQFLDYQRAVFVRKVEGLSTEPANRSVPPSDLTLAKLVRHLTFVEDYWANDVFAGRDPLEPWASAPWSDDPDWEMTSAAEHEVADLLADLAAARSRADGVYRAADSLDQLAASSSGSERASRSLRWILVHLIEEYARHLGHADWLRQAADGATGD